VARTPAFRAALPERVVAAPPRRVQRDGAAARPRAARPATLNAPAMVVEYVRYGIPDAERDAFERGYADAGSALRASPHCLAYELARCVDDPTQYVLRIEWDSAEGHMQGFRRGPEFPRFFAAIRPFVAHITEMRHYEQTAVRADRDRHANTPSAPDRG
jgi:quinol monooxygenase YgiN